MNFKVIKETGEWIVIDKPAGLSVHNDKINVLTLLQKRNPRVDFHLVHRLDQETSGVLLVAKDAEVAATLSEEMRQDSTEKRYQAVLRGKMKTESADWKWSLSDKAEGRKNPQGLSKDRKDCETLVKVIKSNDYFTLVECEILTGRQHQIRKHAAIAKHAIVGDKRYNDPTYNERMAGIYGTERMFLHASELKIEINGKEQVFKAELPREFTALLK
jgi:tRNA pseudouridine65 synthase